MPPTRLRPGAWLFLEGNPANAGSLGIIVRDGQTREGRLLTAAHVAGWLNPYRRTTSRVRTNDLGRTPVGSSYVGFSDRSCPDELVDEPGDLECLVDAALICPTPDVTCIRDLGNGITATGDYYDNPLDPALYELQVFKAGAVSGLTSGVICEVGVQFTVDHGQRTTYPLGYHVMSDTDQQPFCLPGDSEAIVTDPTGRTVGLLVAMQKGVKDPSALGFVIPIASVLAKLDIELIGAGWHDLPAPAER